MFREVHLKKDVGSIPLSFKKKGYETTLIVGEFLPEGIKGVNIFETGNSHHTIMDPLSNAFEFIKVMKKLFRLSPDIVITYNRNPFFAIIIALYKFKHFFNFSKKNKTKFIMKMTSDGNFRFTNFPPRFIDNAFLNKVISLAAIAAFKINYLFLNYITIETECGLEIIKKKLRSEKKLTVVPNGCALEYFREKQDVVRDKEEVILAVSRVVKQKSIETLIKAFAKVSFEFPMWRVKIVGEIGDPNYYAELSSMSKILEIDNKLTFEGAVSDLELQRLYFTSSIFCLPSNWEDDSISRREAMAAGLPVITTEAGCGRSLEKFGTVVVPIGDSISLAEGLTRLMSDTNLRKKISATQMAAIVSWNDVVERYIGL